MANAGFQGNDRGLFKHGLAGTGRLEKPKHSRP